MDGVDGIDLARGDSAESVNRVAKEGALMFASLLPSSASSRPSTSVSADRPIPCRLWPPTPSAVSAVRSSNQIPIGQPLACDAIGEAVEPLQGMAFHIALIEPESELVNVPAKMLRADVMEGA